MGIAYTIRRESRRIQVPHGGIRPSGSGMYAFYQVQVLRAEGGPLVRDCHFLHVEAGVIGVRRESDAPAAVDRYIRSVMRALAERESDVAAEIEQNERDAVRAEKFGDLDDAVSIRRGVQKWIDRAAELAELRTIIGDAQIQRLFPERK